jgi:hypothetical protein
VPGGGLLGRISKTAAMRWLEMMKFVQGVCLVKRNEKICYELIQEIAIARDVYCQKPGCGLQADSGHHVFKRDRMATAFLPEAIIGLCTHHHNGWAHGKPEEFKAFMIGLMGEDRYYELYRLSQETTKYIDFRETRKKLEKILNNYKTKGVQYAR